MSCLEPGFPLLPYIPPLPYQYQPASGGREPAAKPELPRSVGEMNKPWTRARTYWLRLKNHPKVHISGIPRGEKEEIKGASRSSSQFSNHFPQGLTLCFLPAYLKSFGDKPTDWNKKPPACTQKGGYLVSKPNHLTV